MADQRHTQPEGGDVPAKSKITQRMPRKIGPAEQQHRKELSMKDKEAFRSEWGKKVMGSFVEGTEERKEWQTVNVEEGTYVLPSRMFGIQGGTEADMGAAKNTLEKCMRMVRLWMWWDLMAERFLLLAMEKKYKEVLTHHWSIFTKGSAHAPIIVVEKSHSCAKGTGKAKTSSAPDEERGSEFERSCARDSQTVTNELHASKAYSETVSARFRKETEDRPPQLGFEARVGAQRCNASAQCHRNDCKAVVGKHEAVFGQAGCKAARGRASPRRLLSRLPHAERRRDQIEVRRRSGCSDRQIRERVRTNH